MSREAMAIGSTTKPPVLFRSDYPQWKDRFQDFIDRQDLCEEIQKSLDEGPATFYALVLLTINGTVSHKEIPLEWSAMTNTQRNRIKRDRLAKSFLLQSLPNDIYTSVDSHKTAKAMWDEIAKQMQG